MFFIVHEQCLHIVYMFISHDFHSFLTCLMGYSYTGNALCNRQFYILNWNQNNFFSFSMKITKLPINHFTLNQQFTVVSEIAMGISYFQDLHNFENAFKFFYKCFIKYNWYCCLFTLIITLFIGFTQQQNPQK